MDNAEMMARVQGMAMDEMFESAAMYVSTNHQALNQPALLKLYGLYKQATEGPCNTPQPSLLSFKAREKWNAWNALGPDLTPGEAKKAYVELLYKEQPELVELAKPGDHDSQMGVVVSTLAGDAKQREQEEEEFEDLLWWHAKQGDVDKVRGLLEKEGVEVCEQDDEGRQPIHWAADSGHIEIVRELVAHGADVNAKDADGQSPLHYAVACEQEELARVLVELGANPDLEDEEGETPKALKPAAWEWM